MAQVIDLLERQRLDLEGRYLKSLLHAAYACAAGREDEADQHEDEAMRLHDRLCDLDFLQMTREAVS